MQAAIPLLSALVMTAAGCGPALGADRSPAPTGETAAAKIAFDVEALDADGLTGPPDGKRAVSYEFCIPAGFRDVLRRLAALPYVARIARADFE